MDGWRHPLTFITPGMCAEWPLCGDDVSRTGRLNSGAIKRIGTPSGIRCKATQLIFCEEPSGNLPISKAPRIVKNCEIARTSKDRYSLATAYRRGRHRFQSSSSWHRHSLVAFEDWKSFFPPFDTPNKPGIFPQSGGSGMHPFPPPSGFVKQNHPVLPVKC
jgi:hypothetical protein